jgi:hypothetical protein
MCRQYDFLAKKTKGDRLGWSHRSKDKDVDLAKSAGNGKKVDKNTYSSPNVPYRTLVR